MGDRGEPHPANLITTEVARDRGDLQSIERELINYCQVSQYKLTCSEGATMVNIEDKISKRRRNK